MAGGMPPLQTVGVWGEINLTILGTNSGRGNDVESRRFKSKESVHACRSRGGSAGFKSCHSPWKAKATCSCDCAGSLTRTHTIKRHQEHMPLNHRPV